MCFPLNLIFPTFDIACLFLCAVVSKDLPSPAVEEAPEPEQHTSVTNELRHLQRSTPIRRKPSPPSKRSSEANINIVVEPSPDLPKDSPASHRSQKSQRSRKDLSLESLQQEANVEETAEPKSPEIENLIPTTGAISDLSDLMKTFETVNEEERLQKVASLRRGESLPDSDREVDKEDASDDTLSAGERDTPHVLPIRKDPTVEGTVTPYSTDTSDDSLDERKEVQNLRRRMSRRTRVSDQFSKKTS